MGMPNVSPKVRCPTCSKCAGCPDEAVRGRIGQPTRVAVSLSVEDLGVLVLNTFDEVLRDRLLCAMDMVDEGAADKVRDELRILRLI